MITAQEMNIIAKYSDKILELIDCYQEMTQSDLQGVSEAIVLQIIQDVKKLEKGE